MVYLAPMKTSGVEHVPCNLCGADAPETLFQAPVQDYNRGHYAYDSWDVGRCPACGLIYLPTRLDGAARDALYAFLNAGDQRFVQGWFLDSADLNRPTWQRLLRVMARHCPRGRLLDFGCGPGDFLSEARSHGYDVAGYEVSAPFLDTCRRRGLPVADDLAELAARYPGGFDCITSFDVIEHHPDPLRMLRDLRALLKDDGLLMISTHDIGNPFARLYGPRWRHLNPIGHLTFFTRETLTLMLERAGFAVIRKGGHHTIDSRPLAEARNWLRGLLRVVLLRGLLLLTYKPLAERVPALQRWQLKVGGSVLNHQKLSLRIGDQVIINDDMVLLARPS